MNSRSILIFLLYFISGKEAAAQKQFAYTISSRDAAVLQRMPLLVRYEIAGEAITDTVVLRTPGKVYRRSLPQPVAATLLLTGKSIKPLRVFLSNEPIALRLENGQLATRRTKLQNDFAYLTEMDGVRPRYFPKYADLNAKNDTAGLQQLSRVFDSLKAVDIGRAQSFVARKTNQDLLLFAFSRFAAFATDYAQLEQTFQALPSWARSSPDGKDMSEKILNAKRIRIGADAPGFTLPTATQTLLSLQDVKADYVLIEFWASWCVPCRKENPGWIKVYSKLREKNFQILGISLDQDRADWLSAIEKDGLPWPQLSDLRGWRNAAALAFGVQAIPANFLLDGERKIVAKNLSPMELEHLLTGGLQAKKAD